MIRQELFNQFIQSGMLSTEMVRAVALIHTAQRLTTEIHARRLDAALVVDNLEFRVDEFIDSPEGDLALTFYRPEKSSMDGARLSFGDDFTVSWVNSWVPDPVSVADEGEQREERRSERFDNREPKARRENMHGRPFRAIDFMGPIEIDMIRTAYHKVSAETVDLLRGFWRMAHPVHAPRKHSVDDIVFALGERDRLEAMFEVRLVRPGGGDSDLDLIHLLTGEPRTTHSSRYGTEQDWLKSLVIRNERKPDLIPNVEEQEWMNKAKEYVKANEKK